MKEYLINCGVFNIIVLPEQKRYYLLGNAAQANALAVSFVAGETLTYADLQPLWFKYASDEAWRSFDGSEHRLNGDGDVTEAQLIDYFVLKKFNFGSLVAVRDTATGKVQVFKRDRLSGASA